MVRLAIAREHPALGEWLSKNDFTSCEMDAGLNCGDLSYQCYECLGEAEPVDGLVWIYPGGDLKWALGRHSAGAQWVVGGHWASSIEGLNRVFGLCTETPSARWLSFVMQGDSLDVDLASKVLEEILIADKWGSQKDCGRLRTVAQEALTNAWEHGHGSDCELPVEVLYSLVGDRAGLEVIDRGSGFIQSELPDPMCPENMLNESGRGIYIMQKFLDELSYQDEGRHFIGSKRA